MMARSGTVSTSCWKSTTKLQVLIGTRSFRFCMPSKFWLGGISIRDAIACNLMCPTFRMRGCCCRKRSDYAGVCSSCQQVQRCRNRTSTPSHGSCNWQSDTLTNSPRALQHRFILWLSRLVYVFSTDRVFTGSERRDGNLQLPEVCRSSNRECVNAENEVPI